MAAVVLTEVSYPFGDFPNSKVNGPILSTELGAAGLSVSVASVVVNPGAAVIRLGGLGVAGDLTLIDGVVAAHQGADFDPLNIREVDESEMSDDSGSEVDATILTTGPLRAGVYTFSWNAELSTTNLVASTGARVKLYVQKNADGWVERGQDVTDVNQYTTFSGALPQTVAAGEAYSLRLTVERVGASPNPAKIRRRRLAVNLSEAI